MISFKKFLKSVGILNNTDQTKQLILTVSDSATTNTSTTVVAAQTANRIFTLPDASGTPILSTGTLLPNNVVVTDSNGSFITDSLITTTELEKLDGITENIQTALNNSVTTVTNTGSGTAIGGITGQAINLKTLIAGTNVTITNTANDITINSTGGSGDLTPYFKKDGSVVATGNFDLGGFQIKDAADPTDPQDLVTKNYVDTVGPGSGFLKADGSVPMTGNLDLNVHEIHNVDKIVTYSLQFLTPDNVTLSSVGFDNLFQLKSVIDPTDPQDVATKHYVDSVVPSTGFIKADGTIPMAADLNLDGHNITNVVVLDGTAGGSNSGIQIGGVNTHSKIIFSGGSGGDIFIAAGQPASGPNPPIGGSISMVAYAGQISLATNSNVLFTRATSFGVVDFNNQFELSGVIDPTQPQHAATKNYVDTQIPIAVPTTYTKIPTGTTDPTTVGPALYYNTTSSSFRIYDGTTWNTLTV